MGFKLDVAKPGSVMATAMAVLSWAYGLTMLPAQRRHAGKSKQQPCWQFIAASYCAKSSSILPAGWPGIQRALPTSRGEDFKFANELIGTAVNKKMKQNCMLRPRCRQWIYTALQRAILPRPRRAICTGSNELPTTGKKKGLVFAIAWILYESQDKTKDTLNIFIAATNN